MTTTATSSPKIIESTAGDWFADGLRSTIAYGEMLAKDIPAEKFHFQPHPTMNHPAFCYGHLAMYPNKALSFIGRSDLIVTKDGWEKLFEAPAPCVAQDGRYPEKDAILEHFVDRHRAVLEVLPSVSDEVFQRENPVEGRFREKFPTVGAAVNFLLNNHGMLHLGQVSAWRRAAGLPSVM